MSEYVTLLGAEEVRHAASTMTNAAHEMKQAAASLEWVFQRQQQFMNDWLVQFEEILKEHRQ
jgi:hypothetical protein